MTIAGMKATEFKLTCPLMCGGYIENEVLIYLIEGDQLYIVGHCGECRQSGNIIISLYTLLSRSPQARVM